MAAAMHLSYTINHVFLPPKLPQEDDSDSEKDSALLEEVEAALTLFQSRISFQAYRKWEACSKMVSTMLKLRGSSGDMIPQELEASLREMTGSDILVFYIRGQNAGLIIRRLPKQFSFESFELSPTTSSVMITRGRLRRCFPGPAIGLSHDRMADSSFREALAQLLTQLDTNTPLEVHPVVLKARAQMPEIRDTVHPKFVTEMLTSIIRGLGQPLDVVRIHKSTRDDALWDNALKPWRRSPLWLLLRVALQTSLTTNKQDDHKLYKSFMIFFMGRILEQALQKSLPSDILFVMVAKLSRRTLKLDLEDDAPEMQYIHNVVESAHREIGKRWHKIQQNPDPHGLQQTWNPSRLSFENDTQLSLLNLLPYLASVSSRTALPSASKGFAPKCPPRIDHYGLELPRLGHLKSNVDCEGRLSLMDLELWVKEKLNEWLSTNLTSPVACTVLVDLIQDYTKAAAFN